MKIAWSCKRAGPGAPPQQPSFGPRSLPARLRGKGCGRGAVFDAKLCVDLFEMLVYGARAQAQDLRDVAVCLALADPRQHFALPAGQAEFGAKIGRRDRLFSGCEA